MSIETREKSAIEMNLVNRISQMVREAFKDANIELTEVAAQRMADAARPALEHLKTLGVIPSYEITIDPEKGVMTVVFKQCTLQVKP